MSPSSLATCLMIGYLQARHIITLLYEDADYLPNYWIVTRVVVYYAPRHALRECYSL